MNDIIPSPQAEIVREIKFATGHSNVSFVGDSYVLAFEIKQAKLIKGLRMCKDAFSLDFESFENLPISFLVSIGDAAHQYWTVNRRLHRAGGRPSYVAYDPKTNRGIRRWHWNGMLHRTNGPAKEMITGFKVETVLPTMDHHYKESWDSMNYEWWTEGMSAKYPYPQCCTISNGWRIKRKSDKRLDSPREDLASFGMSMLDMRWDISNHEDTDTILPMHLEAGDLVEWFRADEYLDRTAAFVDITWSRGGKKLGDLSQLNEVVSERLIKDLGLWNAPFYKDEEVEFLVLSEYNRLEVET